MKKLMLLVVLLCSGCSTGGYVQLGWIPVNTVNDVHQNVSDWEARKNGK